MFKKSQWTFSVYFLNSHYLVSVQYQYIGQVLWLQSVALSRLYISQTDNELTDCTCNCFMHVEHVFSSGETFMGPHRTGLSNTLEL